MANRTLLLCLLILCSSIYVSEGKWGRSGGRSSSSSSSRSSGSSWGKGWGGGSSSSGGSSSWSSGSSYKPSSSWSSGGSSYKPSSSWSTGSSYSPSSSWNTGSSSSGSSWEPPSFNFDVPKIPTSWGFTDKSSKSHSYPTSSGMSGSNSGSHGYPSSSTGLSGNSGSRSGSGSHSYPSGTGLSGSGSGSKWSGSGSHGYPSSTGLSGSNKPVYSAPPHTWHTSSSSSGSTYYAPPIVHYPQHVYVTQYRDSGSRYGDLLTGLTLYNMGRSHSHSYHDHYYYDDYYRHRYYDNNNYNSNSGYTPSTQDRPKDEAVCNLRIVENGKMQLLKIPCEIVSTFTEGGKKVSTPVETIVNKTVCTTNSTVFKKTKPEIVNVEGKNDYFTEEIIKYLKKLDGSNSTTLSPLITTVIESVSKNKPTTTANATSLNTNALNMTDIGNATVPVKIENNVTEGNKTIHIIRLISSTEEIVNTTVCVTNTTLNSTDPLKVKGGKIDASQMECSVDIKTKDAYFRNNIDCSTLMQYAKKPLTAPKESSLMPERQKLKKWLTKPPWWMSMFIAV